MHARFVLLLLSGGSVQMSLTLFVVSTHQITNQRKIQFFFSYRNQSFYRIYDTFNGCRKSYSCRQPDFTCPLAIFHGNKIVGISFTSGEGKRLARTSRGIKVKTGNMSTTMSSCQGQLAWRRYSPGSSIRSSEQSCRLKSY